MNALVALEKSLKVPILAVFWHFLAVLELPVLLQAFDFFYQ